MDETYEQIRRDILACVLAPGLHVSQSTLGEMYAVGRTPLNNALQRLSHEGLIESIPRVGFMVTPITLHGVQDLFEMWLLLEGAAARIAVARGQDTEIEQLIQIAEFTYDAQDQEARSEFLEHNWTFHRSIALATRNARLVDALTQTLDELSRVFFIGLDLEDPTGQMQSEHKQLAQAILNREGDAAADLAGAHVRFSQHRVLTALVNRGLVDVAAGQEDAVRIDAWGGDPGLTP